MKVKTTELIGPALDWAVATCDKRSLVRNPMGAQGGHGWWVWEETPSGRGGIVLADSVYMEIGPRTTPNTRNSGKRYTPSTDWYQCGPIIEREFLSVVWETNDTGSILDGYWQASAYTPPQGCCYGVGPTPLIAAMRCFCASKMGDVVEVPDGLL